VGARRGCGRSANVARLSEQAPFSIFTTFVFTYGVQSLQMPRNLLLDAILLGSFLAFAWIPLVGYLSDRIGRRRMFLTGSAVMGVFGLLYFALLNTRASALCAAPARAARSLAQNRR
jgi:MFS family permease